MNKIARILILLFIFFCVSCTSESQITQSLSPSPTLPTSENSIAAPPTAAVLPRLSPLPTPEYPLLVTPRITPLSTRSEVEVTERLNYLLQTNGDCLLPCFWGIYPDQTRYDELHGVVDQLGNSPFETLSKNGHLRVSSNFTYKKEGVIRIGLEADLQGDVVRDLEVTILNQLDTGITPDAWSAYNVDKILETYGVPDTVEVYFGTPYDALTFGIRLYYENVHTSITYAGITTESSKYLTNTSAIFCPEEIGIDSVVMHIGNNPFNIDPDGTPLSIVAGIDERTFHKLFTENPSTCLTLNIDAIP